MPNEKNLIPNSERTPEELRKIASAGGRASGVSRRRKRSLREAADLFLSLQPETKEVNRLLKAGVDPENLDNQMAVIYGLTTKAIKGDSKAAKVLIDLLGEDSKATDEGVQIIDDL